MADILDHLQGLQELERPGNEYRRIRALEQQYTDQLIRNSGSRIPAAQQGTSRMLNPLRADALVGQRGSEADERAFWASISRAAQKRPTTDHVQAFRSDFRGVGPGGGTPLFGNAMRALRPVGSDVTEAPIAAMLREGDAEFMQGIEALLNPESPTANDPASIEAATEISQMAMQWAADNNMPLAAGIANDPQALLTIPEIAASVHNDFMGTIVAEQLYGGSFGNADLGQYTDPFTLQAFETIDSSLSGPARQAVYESAAALKGRMRESYLAEVVAYLEKSYDPTEQGADTNFMVWQFGRATNKQQEEFSMNSWIGDLGEFVSQPYRGASYLMTNAPSLAAAITGAKPPQDAWYRRELSPGQNLAIQSGYAPGESEYEYMSGVADGLLNIVGDPLTYAGTVGQGFKAAKAVPLAMSKAKATAVAVIPFVGKRVLGTRSISGRLAYVWRAKTVDDMLDSGNMPRVINWLAAADNPAIIMDRIPEWEHADSLVDAITKESDPTKVRRILSDALQGAYNDTSNMYLTKKGKANTAQARVRHLLDSANHSRIEPVIPDASAIEDGRDIDTYRMFFNENRPTAVTSRVADNIDVTGLEPSVHKINDGPEVTITSGRIRSEDGDTIVTVARAGDEIVGIRQGTSSAVRKDFEGKGVYEAILRNQKDNGLIRASDFSAADGISPRAANTLNRVFPQLELGQVIDQGHYTSRNGIWVRDPETGRLTASRLDGSDTEKVVFHQNAKILNFTQEQDAIKAFALTNGIEDADEAIRLYAQAEGAAAIGEADALIVIDEGAIFRGLDSSNPVYDATLEAALNEQATQLSEFSSFRQTRYSQNWIIKDMPTGFKPDIDDFDTYRPRRFSGASRSKNWWIRAAKSRMFGAYPPSEIRMMNRTQGYQDLRKTLHYWGLELNDVNRLTAEFLNSGPTERFSTVQKILLEAAETIDHPLIKGQLSRFFRNEGQRGFGTITNADGTVTEVLMTRSMSDPTKMSPRPFIPSMVTHTFPLPEPVSFMKSLKRYKWSKGVMGPRFARGMKISGRKSKARIARENIVRNLESKLGKEVVAGMDKDELIYIAYSVVDPATPGASGNSGLGAISRLGNTAAGAWRWGVKAFSVAQLAGRPFAWFGRVILDENARAAFFDLPTVMTNPKRFMSRFFDARALRKANEYRALNAKWAEETMARWRDLDDSVEIFLEAKKVFPDLESLLPQVDGGLSPAALKRHLASLLNEAAYKNDWGEIVGGVPARRQRAYGRAIRVGKDLGFDVAKDGFSWEDDIPEIANQGIAYFASLHSQTRPVNFVPGRNTPENIVETARTYQNNLQMYTNDPLIRVALRRLQSGYEGTQGRTPQGFGSLLNSRSYKFIEPYVQQWADEAGLVGTRAEILTAYIDTQLMPFVRQYYSPLLDQFGRTDEKVLALERLLTEKKITIGDDTLDFRRNSNGFQEMHALVQRFDTEGIELPKNMLNHFDPFSMMDDDDLTLQLKKVPSRIIKFFGNELSQRAIRRGSYIDIAQREKSLRMRLGLTEEAATEMGRLKAAEVTNNVYYSSEQVTPFLKNMNTAVPFFTAFWEIAQTWAYKIPASQGPWASGAAVTVRKVDRVMDALRNLGLIYYDENGTPTLAFDQNADSGAGGGAGDALSKGAANVIGQPILAFSHILNWAHNVTSAEPDVNRDDVINPSRFEFAVSSPIDIQNYGIGSALDVALTPQAPAALGLSWLRQQLPAVASTMYQEGEGSIADTAEMYDVDPARLIAYNIDKIKNHIGIDVYHQYLEGTVTAEDIDVTGLELSMPNTSVWGRFVDDFFFPFGDINSPGELISQYQPSWVKYALRSAGIWSDNNPQEAIDDGFLGIANNDLNKAATSNLIISSLRHMQAEDGVLDTLTELTEDFYALARPYLDLGNLEIAEGTLKWTERPPADAREVDLAYHTMNDFEENMWARAIENAASVTLMRGLLAFFMPGTPRIFFEEERAVDSFYNTRNTTRDGRRILYGTNIDDVIEYVNARAEDPTGPTATNRFLEARPELRPYLIGATYWEPGGAPPLSRSLELYFDDVERGLRSPKPYEAWIHQYKQASIEEERRVNFEQKYGTDPVRAASASLTDPQGYRELMEPYNIRREMLLWEDELGGGEYQRWRDRNRDDDFSIIEEQLRFYNEFEDSLSDVVQIVEASPSMNVQEIKSVTDEIKGFRAGIREIREELEGEESELDWLDPVQRTRLQYFDEVYGAYLDDLGKQYDRLSDAQTDEEQDIVWNKIAQIKDDWASRTILIDGVPFINPVDYQLENKNPEIREAQRVASIGYRTEWLSEQQVDEILRESPQLERYLPSTPRQRAIYDDHNNLKDEINRTYNNGLGEISYRDYQKLNDLADEIFQQQLVDSGLQEHAAYRTLWPVQRLALAGELPPSFTNTNIVQLVSAVQELRVAEGFRSVGEDHPGRQAINREIWRLINSNPQFRDDLVDLGTRMFGETLPDAIIPILFFNDRF